MKVRSNSLDVVGDIMAVAYQTQRARACKPAGFELFDISEPESPRSISHLRLLGPAFARRARAVVRRRQDRPHVLPARPTSQPRNPLDDQFYRMLDVSEPDASRARSGAGGMPGTREGDEAPAPARLPEALRHRLPHAQHQRLSPSGPTAAYLGYIDGGADRARHLRPGATRRSCRSWNHSPPFNGFTHTVLPLFERDLLDRQRRMRAGQRRGLAEAGLDRSTRAARRNPVPIGTLPGAAARRVRAARRPLRRAQPAREPARAGVVPLRRPSSSARFFNAGVRVYDIARPVPRRGDRVLRARRAARCRRPAPCRSTTSTWTSAASSTRWTASPAACTCWR